MTDEELERVRSLWSGYLDQLRIAGDRLFRADTPSDDVTMAEGLRHLSRIVRLGLIAQLEYSDPEFPVLAQYVDDITKFGCDNPDTIYQRAVVNGSLRYRIVGKRNTVDYLSFITARPGENGRQHQIGHLDTATLKVRPDGQFEITLSPEPEGENWLLLTPDTQSVSVRQTFLDRRRETAADLRIERIGDKAVPPPLTLDGVADDLARAAGFTNYVASLFPDWTHGYLAHVNALPPADQEACLRAGGDPNIHFYRSVWRLAPGEALVVHIPRIPECDTWNLQVDNFWQESMDHRYVRSSINRHTAQADTDGGVTAIIAHTDPGHPNWLDTAGHGIGHFAMRWIRAAEHVDPVTRLCSLEEARALARGLAT
ncbi:MAG: DUF1214 domain-containing protein [Novosphingobium sp.]|nr:DUF1214 domain-containing protein [Novosphingobium sp.]